MNPQLVSHHIDALSTTVYENAKAHGFWDNPRNQGEMIALMHAELSECLEYIRHKNPVSDHIPPFSGVEEELADCLIRILDFAGGFNLNLGEALIAKMKFNETRPIKHGKQF